MKKFITAAALIAAGTAFANAAALVLDPSSTSTTNPAGGSAYGIRFSLSSSSLTDSSASYFLDSLTFYSGLSGDQGSPTFSVDSAFVIYSVASDGGFSYVAAATSPTISSKQLTFGSGTKTFTNAATVSFDSLQVEASATYHVVYTTGETYAANKNTFESALSLSTISNYLTSYRIFAPTKSAITESTIEADSWSASEALWSNNSQLISATVSTIPEPSAFGLLAGVGALALVAARRRRKA